MPRATLDQAPVDIERAAGHASQAARRVADVGEQASMDPVELWTIGHSNHSGERFIELLKSFRIDVLADVRSQPYARYASHFSRTPLRQLLADAGLQYVFLGRELGGRPDEPELYDSEGRVRYGHLAQAPRFSAGLSRLLEGASQWRVAMMCSEEDPTDCHRRLLITRALRQGNPQATVHHIRGDGREVDENEFSHENDVGHQPDLFGELDQWRSARARA